MKKFLMFGLLSLGLVSCDKTWLPKPPGYNRIDLPKHDYQKLESGYPYQLDFSKYSQVEPDSFNLDEKTWINLNYRDFGAKVHLTYKKIDDNTKSKLMESKKQY
jgi:gliding motility-associated lipoprotein GldD